MKEFKTLKSFFFIFLITVVQASGQLKKVKTAYGSVTGIIKDHVSVFKGIPFAAPPVGDLRWKAPQPPKKWSGLLNCDTFPASSVQPHPVPFMMWTQEFITPDKPLSEDCLYLNIWTSGSSSKSKLPVLVWIHGGGFTGGSGACPVYDGQELAEKGVVFVSINYRLGIFGFLAHPDLSKESGHNASGNYALLDQIEALKWIRKNIEGFGGNPDNVTIAGQSAGSMSVNALVASPLAKGLFHKAIAQSGGLLGGRMARTLEEAEKAGSGIFEKGDVKTMEELRKIPADQVLNIARTSGVRFGPVLDGYVLPENPAEHFKQKKHNDVPVMAGWVTGDGALMGTQNTTPEKFRQEASAKYGEQGDEFLKIFKTGTPDELKTSLSKLALISFGVMPAHLWADYNASPSWLYQFSHVPPDKPGFPNYGAFHTSEVPYALHTLRMWERPWKKEDLDLQETMSSYWVNFARTGNPNGQGLPEWKTYSKTEGIIMEFDDTARPKSGLFKTELDFLSHYSK